MTRLLAGFGSVLLLTVVMCVMAARTMLNMAELAADLYAHPFAVSNALLQLQTRVNAGRSDILLMANVASPEVVVQLAPRIAARDSELDAALAVVRAQYLGPIADVRSLTGRLAAWRQTRDREIQLFQDGRFAEAGVLAREAGEQQVEDLRDQLDTLYAFAQNKAIEYNRRISQQRDEALHDIVLTLLGLLVLGGFLARGITRSIVVPLTELRDAMQQLAAGNLSADIPDRSRVSEVSRMAATVKVFKQAARRLENERWIKDSLSRLSPALQQTETIDAFAMTCLDFLVPLVGARVAVFHASPSGNGRFNRVAAWGLSSDRGGSVATFGLGEGIAGEAARLGSTLVIDNPSENWLRINSATGSAPPEMVVAAPVTARGLSLAVMEFAALAPFTEEQRALIEAALPAIALNLEILERNTRTRELLEETQTQAEELRTSEEELRSQSEALQASNEELRVSEEELKVQQEALQAANEELRLKSEALEERRLALEEARAEADRRADELEQASRYKSEFLANMSHELRTPLNSVLILARDLAENDDGNLTHDQVESAEVIHESGTHLLSLINDVLDLSKVEAGKMTLSPSPIPLADLLHGIERRFAPVAADKGLSFTIEQAPDLPATLTADRGKVEQIANNLISNAIKFTTKGQVTVSVSLAADGDFLAFGVADTGIGIAEQDRDRVFAAFEQADSGAARQFSGTGLGLAISRKLARLMGGDITLDNPAQGGSLFTLLLPCDSPAAAISPPAPPPVAVPAPPPAPLAQPTEAAPAADGKLLLVIEDDPIFRRVVCDLARQKGFAAITAEDGKTGLDLARLRRPAGIVLDIGLPGMSGWEVIELLNRSPETRGIPVHVISAGDDPARAERLGTVGHLTKPVTREQIAGAFEALLRAGMPGGRRKLLLVDGDAASRATITTALATLEMDLSIAESGATALDLLATGKFDCLVLDLTLPDMAGGEFLERAEHAAKGLPPVIVYSSDELTQEQMLRIREFTDSIVIKGARSSERLLDEVGLFLHAVDAKRGGTGACKPMAEPVDAILGGRTILLADDDMRNAFALSKVLRAKGLKVLIAQDGAKALSHLKTQEHVDLVLMDIMMPGMDGYQTMEEIRKLPQFAQLPIIALTAKAMAGDRNRCLAAGADDYLPKPVDVARLREMMAALLQRGHRADPS